MTPILLDKQAITIDELVAVARHRAPADLSSEGEGRVARTSSLINRWVAEGKVIYGITTGFGRFKDKVIPPDQVRELQLNLVRSHAVGVGPDLEEGCVRAMLVTRANTLAKGFSGVRPVQRPALRLLGPSTSTRTSTPRARASASASTKRSPVSSAWKM